MSSGEIFNVPRHTGERGRPSHVKIHGASEPETEPEILGAAVPGEPVILDSATPVEKDEDSDDGHQ